MWIQQAIILSPKSRGYHLITDEVVNQLVSMRQVKTGLLHLFIQHTSASLTINENADPTVRQYLETHINKIVPENMAYYLQNYEGADDACPYKSQFAWQQPHHTHYRRRFGFRYVARHSIG